MANILVTGATGFVGRKLVPALIQSGHEVLCAVKRQVDSLKAKQVLIEDLESQSDWTEILSGIDLVIHLAARVHVMQDKSKSPWDDYYKINSLATKNLAQQAAQCGVKRFVFLSSIKVNGEFTLKGAPFTEASAAQPDDFYAQSKWQAEQYLVSVSQATGMEYVILRPPLVYGPEVKANFLKMLQLVQKSWPLPFDKIENKRNFVYIENLVSALCKVAIEPKAANQLFLVADDDSWSLSALLRTLAIQMNTKSRLFAVPGMLFLFKLLRLNHLNRRLFASLEVSNQKLKSQLGWVPPISSEQGLSRTVKWYQNEFNA